MLSIHRSIVVTRCSNRTLAMNPDNTIGIGFCDMSQLVKIRKDEIWPAFSYNPENFRSLHSYSIITVVQQPRKHRQIFLIGFGCVCSYVFRCPDKGKSHTRRFIVSEAE